MHVNTFTEIVDINNIRVECAILMNVYTEKKNKKDSKQ